MHMGDPDEKAWIRDRIEGPEKNITFTENGKKAILNKIIQAEGFEKYLHVKFVGTKRFGLDGGEALIPALEQIIKRGGNLGAKEIKIGMPHRGRLNVLANVMGKSYRAIFSEFFGKTVTPKKDFEGEVVITKRNAEVLQSIAAATQGLYQDGNDTQAVLDFVSEQLKAMDKKEFEAKKFVSYKDRFQPFLIGALLFLLMDLFLFETKTKWVQRLNLFNENENEV